MEIQSLENINAIREEYKLPPGKRNIDKLEKMLSFNKFFIILNKGNSFKTQRKDGKSSKTQSLKNMMQV